MSASIEIRAYVVGFGDCILLTLPDGGETRHVLVDFGRAPNDAESLERFPAIAKDIERRCNGHLDLVVVTHEHLDHLEGFYRERSVFDRIEVEQVWMSLPSHPDYYRDYPKAKVHKRLRDAVSRFAGDATRRGLSLHPAFRSLLENNLSNVDRVNYLRQLGKRPVAYLARGKGLRTKKPFREIRVHVLAPEADASVYYAANAGARALSAAFADTPSPGERSSQEGLSWRFPSVPRATGSDVAGLSGSDYERLRRTIREEGVAAARFIDKAQNNTSLCLLLEVKGKRLLLPGDAELESWDVMRRKCSAQLGPVDFLKVSHHGSHNGTPVDLLDTLLPTRRKAQAQVLVSTKRNVYGTQNPVPDAELLRELRRRCRTLLTTDGRTGTHLDITL
jgi:hypothetical protein